MLKVLQVRVQEQGSYCFKESDFSSFRPIESRICRLRFQPNSLLSPVSD